MTLHSCATCGRSVPEGDCPFCVPLAGTTWLRAGYAVVATVSVGVGACGGMSACAFNPGTTVDSVPDAGRDDDGPELASLDGSTHADDSSTDAAPDAADAADAVVEAGSDTSNE